MTTRIFIADDHAIVREGLRSLLSQVDHFEVVGEASTGNETLSKLAVSQANVLVLDLCLPGGISGARVAEEVLRAHPDIVIVVLTMHDDDYYLKEMLEIGVRAYVLKSSTTTSLVGAIRVACAGEYFVDPGLAGHMVSVYLGRPVAGVKRRLEQITGREREVCKLLAMGHTNVEVGKKLHISERTVEAHRNKLMTRLNLRNRAELVHFAIDNGLIANN